MIMKKAVATEDGYAAEKGAEVSAWRTYKAPFADYGYVFMIQELENNQELVNQLGKQMVPCRYKLSNNIWMTNYDIETVSDYPIEWLSDEDVERLYPEMEAEKDEAVERLYKEMEEVDE